MYYKAIVQIVTTDSKGNEKKQSEEYLVKAVSVTDAETKVHALFTNTSIDFNVKSVSQTKIVDVLN